MENNTIQQAVRGELDAAERDAWGTPLPIGQTYQRPDFPTHALPAWLGAYVQALSVSTQTPADMAGAMGLAIISAALGRKVKVYPYGHTSDWSEPAHLYLMVVGEPGERKSAILSHMAKPIQEIEEEARVAAVPVIEQAEVKAKVLERRKAALIEAVAKGKDPGAQAELDEVCKQFAKHTVPAMPRFVISDITSETFEQLLAAQGGRMALLSAEGGVFDIMAGRYTGGAPNLEAWLKAHAGEDILVDRAYRTARVRYPALTIGALVQPTILASLMAKPYLHEVGFLARFLYAVPPTAVGSRIARAPGVPMPVRAAYHANVKRLLALEPALTQDGYAVPHSLMFAPNAADYFEQLHNSFERKLGRDGPYGTMGAWPSKWLGAVARIAALLHVANHTRIDGEVELATVKQSVAIGGYFLDHAVSAYAAFGGNPEIEAARRVLQWIRDTRADTFTKRDLFRGVSSARFPTATTLDAPLQLLEAHGYVRPNDPEEAKRKVGRPSATWLVNPLALHTEPASGQQTEPAASGQQADIVSSVSFVREGEPLAEEGREEEDTSKMPFYHSPTELTELTELTKLPNSLDADNSHGNTRLTKLTKLTELPSGEANSLAAREERAFSHGYAVVVRRSDVARSGSLTQRAAMALRYTYVGREHLRDIKGEPVGSVSDTWANPWQAGSGGQNRNAAILNFVQWLGGHADLDTQQGVNGRRRSIGDGTNLRIEAQSGALHRENGGGHALACHCPPEPCHAHILAAFANGYEVGEADDGEGLVLFAGMGEEKWEVRDAAELYAVMLDDICTRIEREEAAA